MCTCKGVGLLGCRWIVGTCPHQYFRMTKLSQPIFEQPCSHYLWSDSCWMAQMCPPGGSVSKTTNIDMLAFDLLRQRALSHVKYKFHTCFQTWDSQKLINVPTKVSCQSRTNKKNSDYLLPLLYTTHNVILSFSTCFLLFRYDTNKKRKDT